MVKGDVKIIIAAGGTGGHVFPGVALAEEIKSSHPDAEVIFAGTNRGLEVRICKELGITLILMSSLSIKDRRGLGRLVAWLKLPLSVFKGIYIIMREKPSLLVSIGGYAAGPLSIAAWVFRVPVVVVEPNSIAGFTNRILGRFVKKVFIAFNGAKKYFSDDKVVFSGNPVRAEVLKLASHEKKNSDEITILIVGGSQGAVALNKAIIEALPGLEDLKGRFSIIHQTGSNDDIQRIKRSYEEQGIKAKVFEFSDKIWEYYLDADLVVARAGAITIAELLALKIPSILVPYPYAADDHQRANADEIVKSGGAVTISNKDLTGFRLSRELRVFLERPELLKAMSAAIEKIARPRAAKDIVEECWKLIT